MNKLYTTAVATAISLALGGTALAQQESRQSSEYQSFESSEHGMRASEEMRELDTNRDERIDESEAQSDPELIAAWADVDVDQDGAVNATEYYLYAAQQRIAQLEGVGGQQGARAGQQQGARAGQQQGAQQQGAQQQDEQQARDGEFGRQADQQARGQQRQAGDEQARGQQRQARDEQELGQQDDQAQARDDQEFGQQDDQRQARDDQEFGRQDDQQAGGSGQHPSFEEVDENSDGQLSRTEVALIEGVDFTTADENQDGYVSRDEYMQATEQQQ